MSISSIGSMHELGDFVNEISIWLSAYYIALVVAVSVLLVAFIYLFNLSKKSTEVAGIIGKVIGSCLGAFTAFVLFLPMLTRALWGNANGVIPINTTPPSIVCTQEYASYIELLNQSMVPVSGLLVATTFSAFIVALVWFLSSIREAFASSK